MAITRAQQAKQMLQNGGMLVKPGFGGTRQGYRGPGGYQGGATNQGGAGKAGSVERGGGNTNRERGITQQFKGPSGTTGRINTRDADPGGPDRRAVSQFSQFGRNVMAQNLKPKRFQGLRSLASKFNPLSFILGLINPALGIASRFVTSAPDTFQTFKDSPTLADFLENMKTNKISNISVDSGRGSGLRPTIDMKKPVGPTNLNDLEGLSKLDFIGRENLNDLEGILADQGLLEVPADLIDQGLLEVPADLIDQGEIVPLATGGRVNAMGGGIMDLETARQVMFLGGIAKGIKKVAKKATRAIKKVAKSPIGKAALGLAAFKFGPKFLSGKGFGLGKAKTFSDLAFFGKGAEGFNVNPFRLIGVPALLSGLTTPKQEDEKFDLDEYYKQVAFNPNAELSKRILGTQFSANGGRIGYAEGSKEPVAKKVMPLLDMDGMEKDYRAEGGFVPIGRMEKADDVPARLSKNEFVFTADAVRNAGEGDVDKGAEVMYNMMKNLEAGGEVSEESQGLKGAREMFQTSQRLGEVI